MPISSTVGANRIVPAIAIPHPLGDPALSPADEQDARLEVIRRALRALTTPVDEQTVFEKDPEG